METTEAINWLTQKDVKPTSNRILVLKKLKAEARPVTLLDLSNGQVEHFSCADIIS